MKVLVVDDEAPARKRLKRLVDTFSDYEVIAEATNGQQAIEQCKKYQPDIVLMDIRMPELDGIEAATKISQQEKHPPAIIYCTAYSEHSLEAFETHAVDYLLKPINKDRLLESLNASSKTNQAQHAVLNDLDKNSDQDEIRKHICARVRGNLVLVPIQDIYYFQADQKYITVRHSEGELLIEETLLQLEQEFDHRFLRIHRNALVALDKIDGIHKSELAKVISFKNIPDRLEISRRHLPSVRKTLKNL